jgi:hypothetical protein
MICKGKGMLYSSIGTADTLPIINGEVSITPKDNGGTTNG